MIEGHPSTRAGSPTPDPRPAAEPLLAPPPFTLAEPGTIAFTAHRAYVGQALNRFCLSLRDPANRTAFLADENGYGRHHGLAEAELILVAERDWTGLLLAGTHLQAALKLAATLGGNLWDIGAHNVGTTRQALFDACPRQVDCVPEAR